MTDTTDDTTPTLEVRILRDGVLVQRELCESGEQADAVVDRWSDVEGVVVEIEDLVRDRAAVGVLDPRPWEVDDDRDAYDGSVYDDELDA
jgi:hypothetical protein